MANGVSEELTNRLYEIADTIGTAVFLDKGVLRGQVSHKQNFSGVKVKHALTIIESALTANKSAALVRGPGNLLFLIMKADGSPAQLHLMDASKLDGDPAKLFASSKTDAAMTETFLAARVASFVKEGKDKWEPYKKAD